MAVTCWVLAAVAIGVGLPPPEATVQIWLVFVAKAILLPSGDQTGLYAKESVVIWVAVPPPAETV